MHSANAFTWLPPSLCRSHQSARVADGWTSGRSFDFDRSENGNGAKTTSPAARVTTRRPFPAGSNLPPGLTLRTTRLHLGPRPVLPISSPTPAAVRQHERHRATEPVRLRRQRLRRFGSRRTSATILPNHGSGGRFRPGGGTCEELACTASNPQDPFTLQVKSHQQQSSAMRPLVEPSPVCNNLSRVLCPATCK